MLIFFERTIFIFVFFRNRDTCSGDGSRWNAADGDTGTTTDCIVIIWTAGSCTPASRPKSQDLTISDSTRCTAAATSRGFEWVPPRLQQDVRSVITRWWGITITVSPSSRQPTRTLHRHLQHSTVRHRPTAQVCGTWSAPPSWPAATRTATPTSLRVVAAASSSAPAIAPAQPVLSRCTTERSRPTGRPAITIIITRTTTPPRRPCSSRSTAPRPVDSRRRSRNPTASGYPPSRACSSSPTYVSSPLSSFLGVTSSACCHWGNYYRNGSACR